MSSRRDIGLVLATLALLVVLVSGCSERSRPGTELFAPVPGVEAAGAPGEFAAVDLFLDPLGETLGAWQLEVSVRRAGARVEIVGVEGGAHPSFAAPPAYDPRALEADPERGAVARIVLAAFDTSGAGPIVETRVARLHLFSEPLEPATPSLAPRESATKDPRPSSPPEEQPSLGEIEMRTTVVTAAGAHGERIRVIARAQLAIAEPAGASTETGDR